MTEPAPPALCELLPWDSDFFGVRVARVNAGRLTAERAAQINAWCARNAIDCLYFLADSDDATTTRLAEDHAYRLVDLRMTYAHAGVPATSPAPPLRPATAADLPALERIAAVSYTDSRYYYDPCFRREQCDALYTAWVRNSVGGYADAVHIADEAGQVGGFISCHLTRAAGDGSLRGSIGLVGVAENLRGRGVGGRLVGGALAWFARQGARPVTVVTQGRNLGAQKLYQRAGFTIQQVQLYYHKWYGNCLTEGAGQQDAP